MNGKFRLFGSPNLLAVLCGFGLITLNAQSASADLSPPVKITMPADTVAAQSGEVYAGAFEIRTGQQGTIESVTVSGEGWNVLSVQKPEGESEFAPGILIIPFRAIPSNADHPVRLSFEFNGHTATKALRVIRPNPHNTAGIDG